MAIEDPLFKSIVGYDYYIAYKLYCCAKYFFVDNPARHFFVFSNDLEIIQFWKDTEFVKTHITDAMRKCHDCEDKNRLYSLCEEAIIKHDKFASESYSELNERLRAINSCDVDRHVLMRAKGIPVEKRYLPRDTNPKNRIYTQVINVPISIEPIKRRKTSIDVVIDKAIAIANSHETANVYLILRDLALNEEPPFTGVMDEQGFYYTDDQNHLVALSKNALGKRLQRRKKFAQSR